MELVGAVHDEAYDLDDYMPVQTNTGKDISIRYIGGPVGVNDSTNPNLPPYYTLTTGMEYIIACGTEYIVSHS